MIGKLEQVVTGNEYEQEVMSLFGVGDVCMRVAMQVDTANPLLEVGEVSTASATRRCDGSTCSIAWDRMMCRSDRLDPDRRGRLLDQVIEDQTSDLQHVVVDAKASQSVGLHERLVFLCLGVSHRVAYFLGDSIQLR